MPKQTKNLRGGIYSQASTTLSHWIYIFILRKNYTNILSLCSSSTPVIVSYCNKKPLRVWDTTTWSQIQCTFIIQAQFSRNTVYLSSPRILIKLLTFRHIPWWASARFRNFVSRFGVNFALIQAWPQVNSLDWAQ